LLRASVVETRFLNTSQSVGRRPLAARAWRAFQTVSA
jgi:hypothetical protein